MPASIPVRLLLAVAASLGVALALLVVLYATDLGFSVWARLQAAPGWFVALYAAGLAAAAGAGAWVVWRVGFAGRRRGAPGTPHGAAPPEDEASLDARIASAAAGGADVSPAAAELEALRARRAAGEVHVALLGRVSTGKSSLLNALLPGAARPVDPRAGTTRSITRHVWTSPAGDRLVVSDLPGLHEPDGAQDAGVREEALRAHVVVFLSDGDLTRDEHAALREVLALGKPTVLALNKSDLYSDRELEAIAARLRERAGCEVVTVSAGGTREVLKVHPDGREEPVSVARPARVDALAAALQRVIDGRAEVLESLRDAAVFSLVARKLDAGVRAHRRARSEAVIAEHTRKAVIGALAAVSPGTDVVIQGYLGVQLVKRLCAIHEVSASEVDVDRLLGLAGGRVGHALPLTLAMAGNALKAFPGVGTITGGLAHAVAYGLLFDSLGRAVALTLETRGALTPAPAAQSFEERLGEDLGTRARRIAGLALSQAARPGDTQSDSR